MKPEFFLASNAVFSREEFVSAMRGRGLADATVDSHLTRWRRQGRIVRVKPGVFLRAEVPGHAQPANPDYLALASRMAPDAVLGYHTALEAHGMAQSVFERFTFLTWTKARPSTFLGRRFVPVRPRVSLRSLAAGNAYVERAERRGVTIRITSIERTLADVLDRPGLSGGLDEVWRSLSGVPAIDPEALERYVSLVGSRTLAAKVGFFLETRRQELAVPDALLERLRTRVPRAPVFMDRRLRGRLVANWALIVPPNLLENRDGEWT